MATSSGDETELDRLRALLRREQSLREEEQSLREEEQRRREEAEKNQQEEQRRREEAEQNEKNEQKKRKEAEKKQEEERRRRQSAEIRAQGSRLQSLEQYLDGCHSLLSLAIHVETAPSSTTQGDATNPTGRVFPRRIIPWAHFPAQQEHIWALLADQPFCHRAIFPSPHQLDYVVTTIKPIASETDLRHFARDTVEIAVQKLVNAAHDDDQLRAALDIQGSVTFESHTNLGGAGASVSVDALTESIQHVDIDPEATGATTPPPNPSRTRAHRKTKRGKSGPADQFCVYRRSDGRDIPALAIEYKAPHKLTRDHVVTGLQGEIQPERDVINKHGDDGFAFASRWLVTAVVTQLFSYMVDKGIQYGYLCTGETFVFLHIPRDPTIVYYSVCVPNLDVVEDDEDRLHRTAVAQVFAFVLQALRSPPLPQHWHDRAEHLGIWGDEFDDILRHIPVTDRKPPKDSPLYKPQRWKGFVRSPIKTRSSRCRQAGNDTRPREKSDSDDDKGDPPSPSASRSSRASAQKSAPTSTSGRGARRGGPSRGRGSKPGGQKGEGEHISIQDRPFCTQKCLLGLASGGAMDDRCPNFNDHQPRHIEPSVFRHLLRDQLAKDRGTDADATPLYLSGSVGALFKVRLSSHGYTVVAKGVEEHHVSRLQHEHQVYDRLRSIQGEHVPVCLGRVDLVLPYYYDGGVFTRFLFLGWAGRPLFDMARGTAEDTLIDATSKAFRAIHKLKILHRDAEPRNVLYDARSCNVMIVDFERASLVSREPLGVISPNRKRKHSANTGKIKKDEFATELSSIMLSVRRYVDQR
ncbi:hypothetical protein F4803DRAFT_543417 [Xylaria telfairii]|nr:hypothetical protein F4803DRAFT_543417 [Xylaria telfairii]